MTKLVEILCLLFFLLLASSTYADIQAFGPDTAPFTVDVPDGWEAREIEGGCQLSSPGKATSLSIQVFPWKDKGVHELAQLMCSRIKGEILNYKEEGYNQVSIDAEVDGMRVKIRIDVEEDTAHVVMMAGADIKTIYKILLSLSYEIYDTTLFEITRQLDRIPSA